MKRRRGQLVLLVAEALRCGRQRLEPWDFFPGRRLTSSHVASFRYAARKAGLVQDPITKRWIPGRATYGFLERYIAQRVYFRCASHHITVVKTA